LEGYCHILRLIFEEHLDQDLSNPEDRAFEGGHLIERIEESLPVLLEDEGEDGDLALIMLVSALP
jgi:hypothetical protein